VVREPEKGLKLREVSLCCAGSKMIQEEYTSFREYSDVTHEEHNASQFDAAQHPAPDINNHDNSHVESHNPFVQEGNSV
jgi:hypothetical protein